MGSMRPPDPSSEPPSIGEVPRAVAEAIDSLARLRAVAAPPALSRGAGLDAAAAGDTAAELEVLRLANRAAERAGSDGGGPVGRAAEAAARAALRSAVERYARDLRRQGVPPERMILAVKGVVRRAATAPAPLPEPEHLIPDLVQWSIAAYFAAD